MSRAVRMSARDVLDLTRRAAGARSAVEMRDAPAEKTQRSQKYGNVRVSEGDLKFDSKAEHKRWQYLSQLERAKEIRDLRLQVPFELIPAQVTPDGKKVKPTVYVADLVYIDKNGELVVEDPKGMATPEWRIKRKLMLQVHGIWVREIRS